jgi:predicted short-subunit dehydrogenase-like oxidoreductase (DUF2520 family)
MKISFIGAGKVGTAFGLYLKPYHEILYYYSRHLKSAETSAEIVNSQSTISLQTLIEKSEVIFITTQDHNISEVVNQIEILEMDLKYKSFVHMSGALTSDILLPLKNLGARIASVHPLQTFPSIEKGYEGLKQAYFAIEGDGDFIKPWLDALKNPYFELKTSQKSQYHMAACIFSNYLVSLMAFGSKMLEAIHIDEEEGLKAMMPLIQATVDNVMVMGPKDALTGPIKRGDLSTLKGHMETVGDLDLELYKIFMAWTSEHLIDDPKQKEMLKALWR